MATAKLILNNVPGYPGGTARVYEVSPSLVYEGVEYRYMLVWVRQPKRGRDASVVLFPCTADGALLGESMRARPGSWYPHGNPFSSDQYLEECIGWALAGARQGHPDDPYTIVKE